MLVFVIEDIRLSKKITLYKLSKETQISRTYLKKLEDNIVFNPTLNILYKIAKTLNVDIKELFYTDLEIDNLKEEMYERIDKFGIGSAEVLEISHIIDLLINVKMQEKN